MRRERNLETKTVYIPLWGNRIIRLEKWLSEQAARGWIVEKIDLRGFQEKAEDKDVYVLQKCRKAFEARYLRSSRRENWAQDYVILCGYEYSKGMRQHVEFSQFRPRCRTRDI